MQQQYTPTDNVLLIDIPCKKEYLLPSLGIAQLIGYVKAQGHQNINTYVFSEKNKLRVYFLETIRLFLRAVPKPISLQSFLNRAIQKNWFDKKCQATLDSVVLSYNPMLIGFSLFSFNQVLVAIQAAKQIKRTYGSSIRIVFGGPCVSIFYDVFTTTQDLRRYVDYFSIGPGEETIVQLIRACKGLQSIRTVPNLYFILRDKYTFTKVSNPKQKCYLKNIPDYTDYGRLQSISIQLSLGCYWGKCAFCTYRELNVKPFFMTVAAAVGKIETLLMRYSIQFVDFSDDALPPLYLEKLCKRIIQKKLVFSWSLYVCADPGFASNELTVLMKQAGCTNVVIGVESLSDTVLEKMQKLQRVEDVSKILQSFYKAKIKVRMNMISGFPGETPQTQLLSLLFVKKNKRYIDQIVYSPYRLERNTQVYRNPKLFGISIIDTDDNPSVLTNGTFSYTYTLWPKELKL